MRKPEYMPILTQADYRRICKYSPARSRVYCFLRDLLQGLQVPMNSEQEDSVTWFAMAVFEMGRENGIREERHCRRVKQNGTDDPERTSYTEAILRLLKAADLRKLCLVWVYASHLIR